MRMFFLPRRPLIGLSMLAVLLALVGAVQWLGGNEQVTAWVAAGLGEDESPVLTAGQAADAVTLLIAVEEENTADEVAALLELLADNQARAAFFISRTFAENNPDSLLAIKAGGHQLGVLGAADGADYSAALAEMAAVTSLLEETAGETPLVYMPAGGLAAGEARRAAKQCGLMFVLGGVDSGDWQAENAEQIIAQVLNEAEAGSFISISPGEKSLAALNVLLPELAAKGLACRTVAENLAGGAE